MVTFDWRQIIGLKGPASVQTAPYADVAFSPGGSTGQGPDFPDSAGDRERGKFRPSQYPRLTAVAVTADDGTPIGYALVQELGPVFDEILAEVKALRLGLVTAEYIEDYYEQPE